MDNLKAFAEILENDSQFYLPIYPNGEAETIEEYLDGFYPWLCSVSEPTAYNIFKDNAESEEL